MPRGTPTPFDARPFIMFYHGTYVLTQRIHRSKRSIKLFGCCFLYYRWMLSARPLVSPDLYRVVCIIFLSFFLFQVVFIPRTRYLYIYVEFVNLLNFDRCVRFYSALTYIYTLWCTSSNFFLNCFVLALHTTKCVGACLSCDHEQHRF